MVSLNMEIYTKIQQKGTYTQQILNRTVRVEEGSSHGTGNLIPRKTHALHLSNNRLTPRATKQRRRVIEGRSIGGCLSTSGRGRSCRSRLGSSVG